MPRDTPARFVVVAMLCTYTGIRAARVEPHMPHAAALAAGAVVTFIAAVLAAVAFLTPGRSRRP
ncbi:hypothetical protein JY651_28845 [Pyxidicoccus parkwayensis]|uniref:Uncharacterized protein n=1 Tax=Pyxidicoccus parkwayensis TaxID=2813578 RepID=A0ABX7NKQ3_9BACT|nr:hypothetical protein [Pyxidicoccus parkwaysis]QSQ19340.1 hypothetical protein JY651_28845 [Pyxidicoccus parkwaysis]